MPLQIKEGDLFPDVITTVTDEAGDVVDVTDASVTFSMRKARGRAAVLDGVAATVDDGEAGKIKHAWASGETDTPGTYEAEFIVDPTVGDAFRVPTAGYIEIIIYPAAA